MASGATGLHGLNVVATAMEEFNRNLDIAIIQCKLIFEETYIKF